MSSATSATRCSSHGTPRSSVAPCAASALSHWCAAASPPARSSEYSNSGSVGVEEASASAPAASAASAASTAPPSPLPPSSRSHAAQNSLTWPSGCQRTRSRSGSHSTDSTARARGLRPR